MFWRYDEEFYNEKVKLCMDQQQKKSSKYGNDSISSLKGADRVRLRPAAILGSDGLEGCQHTFIEILANSIDEAREGFGKIIEVTRYKDRSIQIRDYGRGCPVIIMKKRSGTTGSWFTVNSTPAENTPITQGKIMSSVSV